MQKVSLGAYVLGALDATERLEIEEHLRDCQQCRDELVRLAPLPGLLGQVSLDDVLSDEPPIRPAEATPAAAPPPRHRRRILASVAAAAVLLVGVGLAGRVVVNNDSTTTAATWSTTTDASGPGIKATAALVDRGWGTDIELTMDDLPAGARCRLVVVGSDGRNETAGWWTTGYSTQAEVPASTSIESNAINRMEIRAGAHVLAVLHPTA